MLHVKEEKGRQIKIPPPRKQTNKTQTNATAQPMNTAII